MGWTPLEITFQQRKPHLLPRGGNPSVASLTTIAITNVENRIVTIGCKEIEMLWIMDLSIPQRNINLEEKSIDRILRKIETGRGVMEELDLKGMRGLVRVGVGERFLAIVMGIEMTVNGMECGRNGMTAQKGKGERRGRGRQGMGIV